MAVTICGFQPGTPAEKLNIPAGSKLLSVNGEAITDVLDYGFYTTAEQLQLLFQLPDGSEHSCSVKKEQYAPLGLESESFLMDKEHACRNKCIFCFVDQNPHGMRPSIYFKDDDERLSFLFGSYVTLTNLSDADVERIIKMKISPVNISVHATDEQLRCRMMGNRFAGDSLRHLRRLAEAGTNINCQVVVCRGWNDGEQLKKTLLDLVHLHPAVGSVAVVPVGLTKHREGLTPLTPFDKPSAQEVLDTVQPIAAQCMQAFGDPLVFASDELYLMAGQPLPDAEYYADYKQLENGVGMCSQLKDEFLSALAMEEGDREVHVADIATGVLAAPILQELCDAAKEKFPALDAAVHTVKNDFFGHTITVAGLLTAQDLLAQLGKETLRAERLLVSEAMLRRDGDLFLDDMSKTEFEQQLGKPICTISDGFELLDALLGR